MENNCVNATIDLRMFLVGDSEQMLTGYKNTWNKIDRNLPIGNIMPSGVLQLQRCWSKTQKHTPYILNVSMIKLLTNAGFTKQMIKLLIIWQNITWLKLFNKLW